MSTTPVSPAPDQTQLDPNQAPTSGNVVGGVPGIAQPSVQAPQPTTNSQAVSQVAQQPVSQPTLAQQHTGWFHSMLARMNQGDQVPLRDRAGNPVVDPQTGQVKTQPLSSKQMGRSILAGVLSAMAATESHQSYRNGNGIWENPQNEAVQAGEQAFQGKLAKNQIAQAQAQATSQRTQQYSNFEANMKMLAQTQQLYQLKGDQMTKAVANYKDLSDQFAAGGIVNPDTGESLYDPNYANMTPQEAEDHLKKGDITRNLMFPVSVEPIIGQDGQPTGQSQLRWAAINGPSTVHVNQSMIDAHPELKGVQPGATIPVLQYLKLARTSADNSSLGSMIQNVADTQVSENMPGAKQVTFDWDKFRKDARLTPDQAHQMHALAGLPPDEFMSKIRTMDSANGGGGRIAEALVKQGINIDTEAWKAKRAQELAESKDVKPGDQPADPKSIAALPSALKTNYEGKGQLNEGQIKSVISQVPTGASQDQYDKAIARADKYSADNRAAAELVIKNTEAASNRGDKGYENMLKTGINPITKERLSLDAAPDEMLIDTRTGKPIPTGMMSAYKPAATEIARATFANSAIHSLDKLNDLIANSEAKFGPIVGPVDKWMAGHGLGNEFQQEALNYLTFAQSASTGAHVGGRFNIPIMDKMSTVVSVNMNKDQLKGATESIKDVMQQYADQGGRISVAQWKELSPATRNRLLSRDQGASQAVQPGQPGQAPQFSKFSSDGKWGWDGKQWVGTGR